MCVYVSPQMLHKRMQATSKGVTQGGMVLICKLC